MPVRSSLLVLAVLVACKGPEAGGPEDTDPTDTDEVSWEFDAAALLEGAFSDVPDEALAAYPAPLGGVLTRHTAITGLEFHIPGVPSSEEMSPTPIPVLKEVNGVAYWQVTGEMSARVTDDIGVYHVVGPIDAQGVNHRDEAFDPYEPASNPDDTASHPRAGLPGAFFAIRWPAEGWNGGMIQFQAPGDGGFGFPQAPLAWMSVDPTALMDEGYAIVTVGAGSTVYARKNADGTETIDTNPESGTGIFWTEEPDLWPDNGVWETDQSRLVPNERVAHVDAAWVETAFDADTVLEIYVPEWNEETGEVGLWIQETGFADPYASWPVVQAVAPEMIRDAAVVFKNFMGQATGEGSPWTVYLGWSGSGIPAFQLASGKQNNALVLTDRAMGSPPNAGNFNVWRDPSSGRRFDAFVVYAGAMPWPWFYDDTDLDAALVSADADPEYPIGAPYVFLHGDADLVVSQVNPYVEANAVARAWPGSSLASESIDDYVAILHFDKMAHQQRDQFFPVWDEPPYEGQLWWDPELGEDPASLNGDQVGRRISEPYTTMYQLHGDGVQGAATLLDPFPRMTPLYFALFDGLRAGRMPQTRVDTDIFDRLDTIDVTTPFPLYENPCGTTYENAWESSIACRDALTDDGTAWTFTLSQGEVDALNTFATENPMSRSTERLLLPDVAAPLGYFYFLSGIQARRDFTEAEFGARYGTEEGYVQALSDAADALAADGLWDKELGQHYLDAAASW